MNCSNLFFFELVRAGLWEEEARLSTFNKVDYKEIYRLAVEQSVLGLVAAGVEHLSDTKAPQEFVLQIVGDTLQLELQNSAMNDFIAMLIDNLRNKGVYTLLLKGQGIAQCYERPLWRACGDVDLFLSDDNYEKAKDVLTPLASFVETEYRYEKHLGMIIKGWTVELHGNLRGGLSSRVDRELDAVKSDTFYGGNVRSWTNRDTPAFLLGAENDVIFVFTHILQHFFKGGIGLRQICDWCRLLWTFRDTLNYEQMELRIKKMGLISEWKAFGAFAVNYLGMPVEALPLYSADAKWKRKAARINDFILMSGNFGHNRDISYFSKYPFVIRKCCSMRMRVSDLYKHACIFPLDSMKFFPIIMWNGMRSAVRGEG